ncbi:MAG: FAD binding domain-containing protein [Gammaproteobacteria bacterium]|nr:FAD binding domain-containing protein [Gammaproteobacteria bacterium]MXW46614.1 hypothetical protein [Gammaproteobacteria bacterium]MYD00794.1 hypothetical protein [Gammaproteobacteria bacterium]MYI23851.1 hypothetical protein [Gammaproteobacteria bacterium]
MALTTLEEILQPESVDEVAELLLSHGESAMVMAGGTFIHGLVARGLVTDVTKLIDLSGLGLNQLQTDRKSLRIGSAVTFADLEGSETIRSSAVLAALVDAVSYPPQQIKNAATVGGCVASACPYLDLPIVLLALEASATAAGSTGKREIPLDELFVSLFQTSLNTDEFITGFTVPLPSAGTASSFEKIETTANDLSIVSVAVRVSTGWRKSRNSRIFVGGGIGEVPFRCRAAEVILDGSKLEDEALRKAAGAAVEEIEPFGDHRASAEYRKAMTGVLVERNLRQARARIQ